MKMIPATCDCGVEFLREPHDTNPRCSECFFTHDVPALKILTDQVSTEEQRGPIRQEENRAATTETPERDSVMSDHTLNDKPFSPGMQTYISSGYTDSVDGEHYPGERLDRLSALVFGTEACEEMGTAQIYAITNDDGEQISAIKLTLVDEMRHTAEMTLEPTELQNIADWLQEQAQKLIPNDVTDSMGKD